VGIGGVVRHLLEYIKNEEAQAAREHQMVMMKCGVGSREQLHGIGNDVDERTGHQRTGGEREHEGAVHIQTEREQPAAEGHHAGAARDKQCRHPASRVASGSKVMRRAEFPTTSSVLRLWRTAASSGFSIPNASRTTPPAFTPS